MSVQTTVLCKDKESGTQDDDDDADDDAIAHDNLVIEDILNAVDNMGELCSLSYEGLRKCFAARDHQC